MFLGCVRFGETGCTGEACRESMIQPVSGSKCISWIDTEKRVTVGIEYAIEATMADDVRRMESA